MAETHVQYLRSVAERGRYISVAAAWWVYGFDPGQLFMQDPKDAVLFLERKSGLRA
jgi:hypothetical protein